MTRVPVSLSEIGRRAVARIDALLTREEEHWAAVDAALADPIRTLRVLVEAGGKRLRPAFCHWGFIAAGGDAAGPTSGATSGGCDVDAVGAALELLHTSALIHDDVIDDGTRRHGLPCVHVDYAARHEAGRWRGDQNRFGVSAAILIGDLAFVFADRLMRGAPAAALDVYADLRAELNAGQFLDLMATATGASVERARHIAIYKSGKYTVERPLQLGAALAGRLDELGPPLSAFGVPLGEAFQLRDDLLGAFGDPARIGKGVGDDFREGKPTALYATASERAAGSAAALLDGRYGRSDLTGAEIRAIQDVLVSTGARAAVEARIEGLLAQATDALDRAPIAGEARTELLALAAFVVGRDY